MEATKGYEGDNYVHYLQNIKLVKGRHVCDLAD